MWFWNPPSNFKKPLGLQMSEHSNGDDPSAKSSNSSPLNPNLKYHTNSSNRSPRSAKEYVDGIREGNRVLLSRAITLLESTRSDHKEKARTIVNECLPAAGDSIRVAVTGVPGVGKSTFIETLGQQLLEDGRRLAVLAIDPTSERSKGSILGDKTRMGALASSDDVFIRPSPAAGSLGGVARKTRETIFLCEAAGFDTILVETVGVGQSEVKVHSMVDVFLLLALAGAGDQLQGIKRGIVEMADVVAINKADGENRTAAEDARSDYENALHLLGETETGWLPPVLTCSAETGEGVDAVWESVLDYERHTKETGFFETQRRRQARHWMYQTIEDQLREDFFANADVEAARIDLETQVVEGHLSSFAAAQELLQIYHRSLTQD
jgi:LAO/AO transport system kinase